MLTTRKESGFSDANVSIFFQRLSVGKTLIALAIVLLLGGMINPAVAQQQDFEAKMEKLVKTFKGKKTAAQRRVLKMFDQFRQNIKVDRSMSEASRTDMLRRLAEYRRNFASKEKFPDFVDTIEIEIAYHAKLFQAFRPISNLLNKEIGVANKNDQINRATELVKVKDELEAELLPSFGIEAGSVFSGSMTLADGNTVPYKLHVTRISDSGDFAGIVHDNAGVAGHWKYRVSGTKTGNLIQFGMTENLRGKFVAVKAEGVIVGERMLAVFTQKRNRGKPYQGKVLLRM